MTAKEAQALRDAKGLAAAGRILVSRHAEQRMAERGATFEDVRHALMTATGCVAEPAGRWRLGGGRDGDGDDLTLIVTFESGVVVVTVF